MFNINQRIELLESLVQNYKSVIDELRKEAPVINIGDMMGHGSTTIMGNWGTATNNIPISHTPTYTINGPNTTYGFTTSSI